jgi:hypothetical protein
LQKNPISLAEWIQKQTSKKDFGIPPLEYPWVLPSLEGKMAGLFQEN